MDHQGINLGYRGFIARRLRRTTSFHTLYTRSLSKLIITELKLKAASHSGTSADPILFTIYLFHGRSSLECRHPPYHVSFLAFFSADNQHVKTRSSSLLRQTSDYHPAICTLIFITIELHFGSISNTGQSHLSLVISERNCKNSFYILGILRRQKLERSKGAWAERRTLA